MTTIDDMNRGEHAFRQLMHDAHLATADHLTEILEDATQALGGRELELLIVDHGQTQLRNLADCDTTYDIDGTLPGRVFRQVTPHRAEREGGQRLWVPLLDGLERLGVLAVTFDAIGELEQARTRHLAALTAELLLSKALLSDSLHRVGRRREMSLAAEMQWSLMPPLTAGTAEVSLAAMLEPAYEVGGDLVDYSLEPGVAKVAVLDAVGHGIQASLLASLAVGCYRNRRRADDSLPQIVAAVEEALALQFSNQLFTTAVFATLDVASGGFSWVNAGHPRPLLLRDRAVVKELVGTTGPPLGLGLQRKPAVVNEEQLQPGDRVLLYTDGVTEARTPDGTRFGIERLIDHIMHAEAAGEPIPETMRRLSRALVSHQDGQGHDDATMMLVEWRTGAGADLRARMERGV